MNKVIEDYVLLEKIGQGQYGNVYKAENKKKLPSEYAIARGKIGTWKGTGVCGCIYLISSQNIVSLPYTCPHKSAPINPTTNANKNARTRPSI